MCKKYEQELLGSVPLEPAVGQLCEEGKSIVKEKPDSASSKKLVEIGNSILSVTPRNHREVEHQAARSLTI